jgi:hypothetical protein
VVPHKGCEIVKLFHLADRYALVDASGEVEIIGLDTAVSYRGLHPPVATAWGGLGDQSAVVADKVPELSSGSSGPFTERRSCGVADVGGVGAGNIEEVSEQVGKPVVPV